MFTAQTPLASCNCFILLYLNCKEQIIEPMSNSIGRCTQYCSRLNPLMPAPPGGFLIICSINDEVLNSALEELQLQQQQQQQQRRRHSSEMLQQESRRREKPTFKELASHQIFTQDSNMHSRSKRNFFRHVKKNGEIEFFY